VRNEQFWRKEEEEEEEEEAKMEEGVQGGGERENKVAGSSLSPGRLGHPRRRLLG